MAYEYNLASAIEVRWAIRGIVSRSNVVLGLFRNEGLFPLVDAPTFNQHGGVVADSFPITLAADQGAIMLTRWAQPPAASG